MTKCRQEEMEMETADRLDRLSHLIAYHGRSELGLSGRHYSIPCADRYMLW